MALPGVTPQADPATKGYVFQHTMLRIKDPVASLDFYTRILGMTLLCKLDYNDMKFTLYFLAYADPEDIPGDAVERARWMFGLPACLELTHNHGTESNPDFPGYQSGNTDASRGFGHIAITVPSVEAACQRFAVAGVKFVKKPQDGKMKDLAFIADPDGYWIEILDPNNADQVVNWPGNTTAAT